jgi:hypothetical protein
MCRLYLGLWRFWPRLGHQTALNIGPMTDIDLETLAVRIRQSLGCSKDLAADYAKGISNPPRSSTAKSSYVTPKGGSWPVCRRASWLNPGLSPKPNKKPRN